MAALPRAPLVLGGEAPCKAEGVARWSPDRDEAFRLLYRRNVRAVFAFFAYSVTREQAEDLTATTFERALRAFDRFDETKASERTWLLTIARNTLTDHYRRQKHRTTVSTDEHPLLLDRLVSSDDPLAAQVSVAALVDWLQELNPRQQQVIALRFGAGLSARETAEALAMSEDNVHQVASRALRALRQRAADMDSLRDNAPPRA